MNCKKVHKYYRTAIGDAKKRIWKCAEPGCTHYVYPELAENRITKCWVCGEEVVLTRRRMERKKPHCDTCYTRPDKAKKEEIADGQTWGNILTQLKEGV
jgi:hypothetical protein